MTDKIELDTVQFTQPMTDKIELDTVQFTQPINFPPVYLMKSEPSTALVVPSVMTVSCPSSQYLIL